ncbi:GNAT family N-acetyltransferase [Streptomyces sp. NPDC050504]|uniref:GNAT family N-acetyltransferase n=1 Tax=Streptomyces sp. NPDC050504 TaxID=3365618 RepID=UPI0037BA3FA4
MGRPPGPRPTPESSRPPLPPLPQLPQLPQLPGHPGHPGHPGDATHADLATERLVLHPMGIALAERVVAGEPGANDLWAPGYPTDGDMESAADFLNRCASTGDPRPFGDYEIRRRDDGLTIGSLGFNRPPDADLTVTVGYGLVPSARGRGYATEALRELLRFARERGITAVKGDTDDDNIASQRVMLSVGMRLVARDGGMRFYAIDWDAAERDAQGRSAVR